VALIPPALRDELPHGWEANFDDEGDIFFIDHSTETTHRRPSWLSPNIQLPSLNPVHMLARDVRPDQVELEEMHLEHDHTSPASSPMRRAQGHNLSPSSSSSSPPPSTSASPPRYNASHRYQQPLAASRPRRPGLVRHTMSAAVLSTAPDAQSSASSSDMSLSPSSSPPSSPTRRGSPPRLTSTLIPAHRILKETSPPYRHEAQVHAFEADTASRSSSASVSFDMDIDEGCAVDEGCASSSSSFSSTPPLSRRSRHVHFDERAPSPRRYDSGFSETSEDELPDGWACHRTGEGQAYYVHNASKRATWIDPRICYECGVDLSKMPQHWDVGVDHHGIYFIDHKRKHTYREVPDIEELDNVHIVDLSAAGTSSPGQRHREVFGSFALPEHHLQRPTSPPPPRYWSLRSSFQTLGLVVRKSFGIIASVFAFFSSSGSSSAPPQPAAGEANPQDVVIAMTSPTVVAPSRANMSLHDLEAPGLPLMRRMSDYIASSIGSIKDWYNASSPLPWVVSPSLPQTLETPQGRAELMV
jgi:hypothetical protein